MEPELFKQLLESVKEMKAYIDSEVKRQTDSIGNDQYESDDTSVLTKKLAAAQGEFKPVKYNRQKDTYSDEYSDLDQLMRNIRPVLSKYEIALTQQTKTDKDERTTLHTRISHCGQWMESRIRFNPPTNDMRAYDSIMADLKRDQVKLILNLTLEGDPADDAGDYVMIKTDNARQDGTELKVNRKSESYEAITKEQYELLVDEIGKYTDIATEIIDKYKLRELSDLPKSRYRVTMDRIRKNVNWRKDHESRT